MDAEPRVARLAHLVHQLYEQGRYADAIPFATQARDVARLELGEGHPSYARTLDLLGNLHRLTGDYQAAAPLLEQALELTRRTSGEQDPELATTLNNLAMLHAAAGNYAAATPLLDEAHRILERTLGKEHPYFARSLTNRGSLFLSVGDHAAAEPLLRQALELQRQLQGEEHPDVAETMDRLGRVRQALGDPVEAQSLLEGALETYRHSRGNVHPDVASALSGLGQLCVDRGDFEGAARHFWQARKILRATLGEDHPSTVLMEQQLLGMLQLFGGPGRLLPVTEDLPHKHQHRRRPAPAAPASPPKLLSGQQRGPSARGGRARGEGPRNEAASAVERLNREGLEFARKGRHQDAISRAEQSRDLIRHLGTAADSDLARSLHEYASRYREAGNPAAAIPLLAEAREILRRTLGETHPEYATNLNDLGYLYLEAGDYAAAEALLTEALEIYRLTLGETHPQCAMVLNNLGYLYRTMGDYQAAEQNFRRALQAAQGALGDQDPDVATTMQNLAGLYVAMGRFVEAEPLYRHALTIRRQSLGATSPAVAELLDNLGGLEFQMGDYESAARHNAEALDVYRLARGEHHPDVATTLSNLALISLTLGDLDGAEQYLQRALTILRAVFGDRHPSVARILQFLADVEHRRGNYVGAQSLHGQALVIQRATIGSGHQVIASGLYNLAELHREQGNYASADTLLREAQVILRHTVGDGHPSLGVIDLMLASVCAATGREAEAFALVTHAIAIQEGVIQQVFTIGSERQRLSYLLTVQSNFGLCLSLLREQQTDPAAAVQTAFDLVLRRKALAAEALAIQRDSVLGGKYPHLEPRLRELSSLRQRLGRQTLADVPSVAAGHHARLLETWTARQEELEAELARQIPEMGLDQQLRDADGDAVATALPPGAALIEFVQYVTFDPTAVPARGDLQWQPARYLAFVLQGGNPNSLQRVDLGEAETIDALIVAFRDVVGVRPDHRIGDIAGHGAALRARIFDPLVASLGQCKRLFVAPDGELTRLPFEILPTGDGHHLIDQFVISYVTTGRDVLRFETTTASRATKSIVIADPDFDFYGTAVNVEDSLGRQSRDLDRGSLYFSPLDQTREEGERVAALLHARSWTEAEALESRLKACQSPRILHLATHGFFLPNQPLDPNKEFASLELTGVVEDSKSRYRLANAENPLLRSGLALAGANTWARGGPLPPEAEDGLLTAVDVTGMDLWRTELVVLSACDTGLGDVHVGEGVFGLRRAFVVAGAKTLVMSLWKVSDDSARALMEDFYLELLAKTPRAEALRQAQLALKGRALYADPYYWGAFICQGDPAPLPAPASVIRS